MKQLLVLSGKGGTGKTSFVASFAALAGNCVLADCDVDAPDLHLLLEADGDSEERRPFSSQVLPELIEGRCNRCGRCVELCRFAALRLPPKEGPVVVDRLACEGCGVCHDACPEQAFRLVDRRSGELLVASTPYGPIVHARLLPGEGNSGKLVTLVKQQGRLLAIDSGADLLLVDGPPGIGCPVISASAGADMALLVVEPTVSGAHDLDRILGTTDHFGVPSVAVVNKADLNLARSEEIAAYCADHSVDVVGRVPYDDVVTRAMVQGQPVTDFADGAVSQALSDLWQRLRARLLEGEGDE